MMSTPTNEHPFLPSTELHSHKVMVLMITQRRKHAYMSDEDPKVQEREGTWQGYAGGNWQGWGSNPTCLASNSTS